MGKLAWSAVASVLVLASGGPARGSVVWRGDYESGDLSQWSKAQVVSADRLQVVTSPVHQGQYALKVTVRQGDNPIGASGNRNELVYLSYEPEGTERWYRWQTMWPADYPSDAPWQIFTQWHHSGSDGSPPMVFSVRGETVRMLANTEVVWTTPLVRGVWHDFLFHVKWSPDPSVGFVELWYDGALALPKTYTPTQFAGQANYLKQGLYRDAAISSTATIFHDGMVAGTTRQDVDPAAAPAVDAGAPAQPATDAAAPAGPDAQDSLPGPDADLPAGPDAQASPPAAAAAAAEPGPDAQEPAQPWPDAGSDSTAQTADASEMAEQPAMPDVGQVGAPGADPYPSAGCSSAPAPGNVFLSVAAVALGILLLLRCRRRS